VAAYHGSMDFGRLATQRDRRLILDRLRERCGDNLFAGLSRQYVEKFLDEKRDTPFAARNFLKALKAVMAVALRLGLRADDPTQGICVKVPSRGGWRTWTEQDIVQFEAVYSIGTRARLAFALLLYTGQRRGDVIRLGRQHVRDG
jgi:integrase